MAFPDSFLPTTRQRSTDAEQQVIRIHTQGDLVAAVPVLLGFRPRESLVLLATGGASGRRLGLTLRVDLPPPEHAGAVADEAVRALLLDEPAGAAVIVVAEPCGPAPPHAELAALVAEALEGHHVDVHTAVWTPRIAAGARWACYAPCGCGGTLPDPACTTYVAAAVANGQVLREDRSDLQRLVAPVDPERLRRRERLLIDAVDELLASGAGETAGVGDAGLDADVRAAVHVLDVAIAEAAGGGLALDDARVLALAGALVRPAVRDVALLRCAAPAPEAAEQLWAALARETPDPEAAVPAALLAVSALLRGDGALANVALERAESAWPGHRLTALLRTAAEGGVRPEQVRGWLIEAERRTGPETGPETGPDGGPAVGRERAGGRTGAALRRRSRARRAGRR
jgi:hypothetical protein